MAGRSFLLFALLLAGCASPSRSGVSAGDHDHDHDHDRDHKHAPVDNSIIYGSDFITGRCLCRHAPGEAFELPCPNVMVSLHDARGREIRRVFSADGEFVFPGESGKQYSLKVHSRRFKLLNPLEKPLKLGDDVALQLVPKR